MTRPHDPLRLRLDGDALVSNWRWLAGMSGRAACGAAVKADAYGVGAHETVKRLAEAGCRDFFVAHWGEAQALAGKVDPARLAVLHGIAPSEEEAARAGLSAGNAGVRVFRARAALKKRVSESCGTCAEHGCVDCTCGSADVSPSRT